MVKTPQIDALPGMTPLGLAGIEPDWNEPRNWIGERVEIPVHYDKWMQGARFGVVTSFSNGAIGQSDFIRVKLDKVPGKLLKVWRHDIEYMRRV